MKTVSSPRLPQRVKAKFFVPFTIALLLILLAFAVAIYSVERRVRDQDLNERSAAVARLFAQKLDKDTNLMMATTRALMTNAALTKALRDSDREQLAAQGGPLFQRLRNDHHITHLYLISPELVNIYRFHSPSVHGDQISRVTLTRAKEQQDAVHGLELGAMGTLTLRLVMPWESSDGLLGYVEIGEEIEHLVDEIRQSLSIDLLVLVDKQYVQQEQWQQGQALMQRTGDWHRFGAYATLAQTTESLPAALDDALLARLLAGNSTEIAEQGRSLHLAMQPLNDIAGRRIGHLLLMRDISALEATVQRSLISVMLVSLLTAVTVLGVFYLALEKVERDYRRQHDLEHQLLRLNTEHRRLLQTEKLSALGTMVGEIAHQLNNPLVGVLNLAQLAERDADDPARVRELLGDIRSAGEDCRAFIQRMLAFSRVSGFESQPVSIASLIDDTVLLFRQAESRHLPVEVVLEDPAAIIKLDPVLIRHALFNLLLNAAQATEGEGSIRIVLQREHDPVRGIPGWQLSVEDHGRGMAPEVLENIFVPFFTTRSDGTGLGLPVVQHVALLHDGQVTVTSTPGDGTRFALWLPDTAHEMSHPTPKAG